MGLGPTSSGQTVDELLELVDAVQHTQTQYRLVVSGAQATPMDRAQFVLSEVRATLEWAFDDGQVTDEDHQLDTLATDHDGALSQNAVAVTLFDYAELAERSQAKLKGLGGFDFALIAEANRPERDPRWPETTLFDSLQAWIEKGMKADHDAHFG